MWKRSSPRPSHLLGVQPVQFKSPKDVEKGINVASKMFSIYADGVVPGYKKTTRVRIHAVVDFRAASKINSGQSFGIGGVTPTQVSRTVYPTSANSGDYVYTESLTTSDAPTLTSGVPNGGETITVWGGVRLTGLAVEVPRDPSSAARTKDPVLTAPPRQPGVSSRRSDDAHIWQTGRRLPPTSACRRRRALCH